MPPLIETVRNALRGRYDIRETLGEGGMAIVYLADDVKHARPVAVKMLRPELALSLGTERFLAEIAIAAKLAHPNIVPLFDSGACDTVLFYVMPRVEGQSLRERLEREGRLPLAAAVHITCGVAAGLAYAHAHGVVHRDIKPENILMVGGEPLIADFGIAKALTAAGSERLTGTGMTVGTVAYMSPEQAAGDPLDGRSDTYSLACVTFEMLAGAPPFRGPDALAVLSRKVTEPAPRLPGLAAVPRAVAETLARALATRPDQRFAGAAEFAEALAAAAATPAGAGTGTAAGAARPSSAAAPPTRRHIAVLPFANLSGDPGDDYLSDGITEELIHALGQVAGLRVVARSSAFAFKDRADDVREAGHRLGVGTVLEGSVRRAGDRLRVTARLVSVADGYQLWSQRFDRTSGDVFAIQDEVARAAVASLHATLAGVPVTPAARGSSNPLAHELYLRGRHAWNRRTETGLRQAAGLLEQAVDADPGFALALAAQADCFITLGLYGAEPPGAVMPRAEMAAQRALELDSALGEALAARAAVRALYRWDWTAAEQDFQRAIELRPAYPAARQWYAMNCLARAGRFDEARRELLAARDHDPLGATINASLGLLSHFAGDEERAARELRAVADTNPEFGVGHLFLGRVLTATGEYGEAVAALRRAAILAPGPEATATLAYALARAGDTAEATALRAELEAAAGARYVSPVLLALPHAGAGDSPRALDYLEQAVTQRATLLAWLAVWPAFAPLRAEARFTRIIAQLGV